MQKFTSSPDLKRGSAIVSSSSLHDDSSTLRVGHTMLQYAPLFRLYDQYAANYERSLVRIVALMAKNRRFREFVEIRETDQRLKGENLQSLLIMPVQRIPRYKVFDRATWWRKWLICLRTVAVGTHSQTHAQGPH